jgi:hypothetical protein
MKVKEKKRKDFNQILLLIASFGTVSSKVTTVQTPSSVINIEFSDNIIVKKDDESLDDRSSTTNRTPPITPIDEQKKIQEKQQSTKPKSYRDAIGKKEKVTTNDNQSTTETKATKSGKQKSSKSASRNARTTRGHPQDANDYYDDSWYYGNNEEAYLHTGYTDDQEIFVGNLSAQVTEAEVKKNK